jgi:hypothetical protein
MMRHSTNVIRVGILSALLLFSRETVLAFIPGSDQDIMNASSGFVVLDIHSSRGGDIVQSRLAPGYSIDFDGVLLRLRARLESGKVLSWSADELRRLHQGENASMRHWLLEDSGLRPVSLRDYMSAYRRFHKLWP